MGHIDAPLLALSNILAEAVNDFAVCHAKVLKFAQHLLLDTRRNLVLRGGGLVKRFEEFVKADVSVLNSCILLNDASDLRRAQHLACHLEQAVNEIVFAHLA